MARPTLSPRRYRAATLSAMGFLYAIVVTGAAVRLTGSGLGCVDWPNCNESEFVDVSSKHAAIEQVNRLFTGAVGVAVAIAVLGALVRRPRRRDLTWLSAGLVVGVFGQALLGAVVVWTHLNPVAVQGHFLLSMALMANAIVLHRRAGQPDGGVPRVVVASSVRAHAWGVTGLTAVALVTGTVVTGAGPHSGSVDGEPVPRFDLAISSIVRVHSLVVWCTVAAVLWLAWRIKQSPAARAALQPAITVFTAVAIMQGAVGYIQYFAGVPALLVGLHVALATGVWLAACHLGLSTTRVQSAEGPGLRSLDLESATLR